MSKSAASHTADSLHFHVVASGAGSTIRRACHEDHRTEGAVQEVLREAAHHIDRVSFSGGPKSGRVQYRCDCGFASPFVDIDEQAAAAAAFSHLNQVLAAPAKEKP